MNKLEKQIQSNRDRFDSFEPSEEHMERFRKKLQPVRLSLYARIPYGIKVAAILLLVAVSSILIYEQAKYYYAEKNQPIENSIPGEFSEAQVYYTALINEKYSEINNLIYSEPGHQEMLMKELTEMDRLFKSLQKDLQTNPMDERVLSAMINHYQMKLEIMGQIIDQLENVNKINSTYTSHENTEI